MPNITRRGVDRPRTTTTTTTPSTIAKPTTTTASIPATQIDRPRVRSEATVAREQGLRLAQGVSIDAGKLIVDGSPAAARATIARSGGLALVTAAARVCGTGVIAKLSATARGNLVDEMLPLLHASTSGRASLHGIRARSGAFSILEESLLAMKGKGERASSSSLLAALVVAALSEKHPGLRAHMEHRLALLPARVVRSEQAAAIETMRVRFARERPLVDDWMRGTPPTLKVVASVQDEFWKAELAGYRAEGYEITQSGPGRATARKKVDDVVPPCIIEVDLRERDTDVFDALAERDVDVVVYTGHANLGGVAKAGLENGPGKARGPKLVALLACRSKQNIDAVDRRYPGQHLLVSSEGTYGHDDRIVMHKLLDGIVHKKSYAQIEMASKRVGLWESKNYSFPNETAALVDNARVFIPESKTAAGRSISMRPLKTPPPAASLPKGPIDDAVAWLNTIQGYWAEQQGTPKDKAMHDTIASAGWYDAAAGDPLVRVQIVDGRARISVSSALANQDPDALAMMITFAAGKELVGRGDPKRTEHERRMLGLSMVASYVYFLVEFSDAADVLLRQFAKQHGFPPGLSWPVVEKAIAADPENDCSPKTNKMLERGMEHVFLEVNADRTDAKFRAYVGGALDLLRNSDTEIGKLTFELIAKGDVKIDAISDLTRADYLRVRRDMIKEGGQPLPIDRDALDDKRGRAWRAITTGLAGYMWDDRIYVAPGLSPKELAATLVHEVNHVRNRSEEEYRGPKAVLVEEYRAFYAEALFRGDPLTARHCREIKEGVIRDYGLKGVTVDDVADLPPGLLN
ncbi:MAG: hypothetical protein Q8O67_08090 [Deltaproteobacteria bacterium]|nr:hypothetical protein [Deltaproteobacteria bacterium]